MIITLTKERYDETIKPIKVERRRALQKYHNKFTQIYRKNYMTCECGQTVTIGSHRAHILTRKHREQIMYNCMREDITY